MKDWKEANRSQERAEKNPKPALTTLQRLFLVFSLLLLFTSAGFYIIFSRVYRENILEIVTGELESSTDRMGKYLDLVFTNVDNAVSILQEDSFLQQYALSSADAIDGIEFMEFATRLKNIATSSDMISAIDIYIEKNGMMFTSDGGATVHLDEQTVAWYQALMERSGEIYVTRRHREHILYWVGRTQKQVTVVRPIYSYRTGEKKGVIAVSIDESRLHQILQNSENFYSLLVDSDGYIAIGGQEGALPPIVQAGRFAVPLPLGEDKCYRTVEEESYLFIRREVAYPGWQLISFCSVDLLLSRGSRLRNYLLAVVLVSLLLVAVTVVAVLRTLSQRVKVLIRLMEQLQEGNFNVRFVDRHNDEFSYIFQSFNTMVENVNRLFNENYRLKLLEKDAQLKLLQAQINPHFIYNIFDNMSWLLLLKKYGELQELVESVALYYRRSLNDGKPFITVGGVLEKLISYVKIQKIRFRDRFVCNFSVQEELLECRMLNHTLQPLLENAICHGVEPSDSQRHILVQGYAQGEDMCFVVQDDGMGITPERLAEIRRELEQSDAQGADCFALANVNQRIKICYGAPYGLQIDSAEGEGTVVKLRVPKQGVESTGV